MRVFELSLRSIRLPRPPGDSDRTKKVLKVLYGDPDTDPWLWNSHKNGDLVKSLLCIDIESIASMLTLPPQEPEAQRRDDDGGNVIYHYNWVTEDSPDFIEGFRSVGDPAFDDRDDMVEACGAPLINRLTSAAWKDAVESRWLNVVSVFKRVCLGELFGKLFSRGLYQWLLDWSLTGDNVVRNLERLILIDANNYAAKDKLKLIRVAQAFRKPHLLCHLSIMTQVLMELDRIQYAVLGHRGDRCDLIKFLHPETSPLILTQQRFWDLLNAWVHPDTGSDVWDLPAAIGGEDVHRENMMFAARREVLQAESGLEIHFAQRLNEDPYSLVWVCLGYETEAKERVQRFHDKPEQCLSFLCKNWRTQWGSPAEFLLHAPPPTSRNGPRRS